jgi:hypothetical protein
MPMIDLHLNSRKRDTDSTTEVGMAKHDLFDEGHFRFQSTILWVFKNAEAEIPLKRTFYVIGQNRWHQPSQQDACGIVGLESAIGLIIKDPRSDQALVACLPHDFDEKSPMFSQIRIFLHESSLSLQDVEVFLVGSSDGGDRGFLGRERILEFFHKQGISESQLYARWCKEGITQSVFFDSQSGEIQYEEFDDQLLLDSPFHIDNDYSWERDDY